MLQAIRAKADSLIVKVLFGLLILSFCGWGVYDVLLRASPDISVASVGDLKIGPDQLNRAVQNRIAQLRQVFGGSFDLAQAKQLGVVDQQLDQLINADLIQLEVGRLKLAAGDDAVRAQILDNPAFRSPSGQFDPERYRQLLAQNGYSQPQYEAGLRSDIVRGDLLQGVAAGAAAPKVLLDTLYRQRAEKRVADTVFLPFALVTDIGQPSETDLQQFHDQHADLFRAPELRSFTMAVMNLDDMAKSIDVSDADLKDEYQRRKAEFDLPERRHLEQVIAPNQAAADAVENALKSGKTLAAAAAAAKLAAPQDLGTIAKADLPDASIADAAFALPQDGYSAPVKSAFGYHVLHLIATEAPRSKSFDEVKASLRADLQRNDAADAIDRLSKRVEDKLAGGAGIEAVASDLGLKLVKVADTDHAGHTIDGGTAAIPAPVNEFLETAFSASAGETSAVQDTSDGGIYVLRVDKITPAAVRPLADVHDRVLAAWQQQQRIDRVGKEAKEILDAVNAGTSLKDVAAKQALATTTTPPIERQGASGGLPETMLGPLFQLKLHQATSGQSADGSYVAELTQVMPADPAADQEKVRELAHQLDTNLQQDLIGQFEKALRDRFPVEIDRDRLANAL